MASNQSTKHQQLNTKQVTDKPWRSDRIYPANIFDPRTLQNVIKTQFNSNLSKPTAHNSLRSYFQEIKIYITQSINKSAVNL